jgi:HK97 family phage prohead protease
MLEMTYAPLEGMEQRSENDRHYIEGICVPYGAVTTRVGPVPEIFDKGAFAELVASGATVKLTDYNHSRQRVPVGYSERFEERSAGLWSRFRLNLTPEGQSAHANAADGVYRGLSVGFYTRAEEIRDGVRHVVQAKLDHVSLVEDPAYAEAEILAVRGASDWQAQYAWVLATRPAQISLDTEPVQGFTIAIAHIRRRAGVRHP